jgi:hypothetical protein
MQSKASTVTAYLRELPPERRKLLEAVRKVMRANLDRGIEEVMNYGMIGYVIPHQIYPAGYHCDPTKPFPYAGLASQKNYCSLYLFPVYGEAEGWFREEWKKGGKKLDMGKCCLRFKKLEDLDLDVLAKALRRFTVVHSLQAYEKALGNRAKAKSGAGGGGTVKPAGKARKVGKAEMSGKAKKTVGGKPQVKSVKVKPVEAAGRRLGKPQPDQKLAGEKRAGKTANKSKQSRSG